MDEYLGTHEIRLWIQNLVPRVYGFKDFFKRFFNTLYILFRHHVKILK